MGCPERYKSPLPSLFLFLMDHQKERNLSMRRKSVTVGHMYFLFYHWPTVEEEGKEDVSKDY